MSGAPVAVLDQLLPAAGQGWELLFQLAEEDQENWCLLGGQMMYLLAAEAGRRLPRPTPDVDVVVNVRTRKRSTEWLAKWLVGKGFELDEIALNTEQVGHRFVRDAEHSPGRVFFDILAPEGLSASTALFTLRPFRTIQAPGTTQALDRSELVTVAITDITGQASSTGQVRRPPLWSALICKAAATRIVARDDPERDWQDAALALSMLDNPLGTSRMFTRKDRQRVRYLAPLLDARHAAWRPLGSDERDRGIAALEFLAGG
jgi:hypothetical protein